LHELVGPFPGEPKAVLPRKQYGQRRWNLALVKADHLINVVQWIPQEGNEMLVEAKTPRKDYFKGTKLEPAFDYIENNLENIMNPKFTFYWRFLTQDSKDAHMFGGIWPELLGTIYLVILTMIFAVPFGVVAAIYLTEYAKDTKPIALLRSCISTLAGVPSIVFGLFGLAFLMNVVKLPKSVLAGSLTLAILVLPTIIRASEEAIRSVPRAYKEASLGLGATKWHTIFKVVLPASLPGILTGIVISMGRAAGETAPIIFTAAVSVGAALKPWEAIYKPTPALSWNIYNLATEHEEMEAVLHVQYGMVTTLIVLVLLLNLAAIISRAKISKKLKG
jgi:phosphate transport system permease protein